MGTFTDVDELPEACILPVQEISSRIRNQPELTYISAVLLSIWAAAN